MKKMIVFDADGVLLDNQLGGFKELLIELGKEKEVQAIDDEYQKRKQYGPWGLEELAKLFTGINFEEVVILARNYCKKKLMLGAELMAEELKKKGFILGVLSSNPEILLESLREILQLDFVVGTQLEEKDKILTGRIQKKIDRFTKADSLRKKIDEFDIKKKDVIAVGDSLTDLPMAAAAGKFIVFNCLDEKVRQAGDVVIDKKNLQEILYAIG